MNILKAFISSCYATYISICISIQTTTYEILNHLFRLQPNDLNYKMTNTNVYICVDNQFDLAEGKKI